MTKLNIFLRKILFQLILKAYFTCKYLVSYIYHLKEGISPYIKFWSIIKLVVFLMGFVVARTLYLSYTEPSTVGEDWVVVQLNSLGVPIKCFSIQDRALSYTATGVVWHGSFEEITSISMPYRAIRVDNQKWEAAYTAAGISEKVCVLLESAVIDMEPYSHPSQSPSNKDIKTFGKKLDNVF